MTLLDPMSAVLGASVAIPALLALYLLKLRRRPVRVSSTLLWKSAAEDLQANVPLRWLRASWLLLLHLAIVGLLVGALGRPVLSAGDSPRTRVVLVIDRSASMSCRDGPEGLTRLEMARARATDLADRAIDSGATVGVVSLAARGSIETGFTSSRGAARAAIAGITPTDQPGNLEAAVRVVDSLLSGSGEELNGPRATVCVFSDGSFGSDGAPAPAGAVVSFVPVGSGTPDNAGIVSLAARRDYDDPGTVRVFARVLSAGPGELDLPVSLAIDGEVVERRVLRSVLPAPTADAPAVRATTTMHASPHRAEAVTTFQVKRPGGGSAVVSIDRPDLLVADNSGAIVLPPATRASVVLVKPDGDAERPTVVPAWLLENALSELDAASFRVISASEYERLAGAGAQGGIDLFVFDRVTPRTAPPGASLSFGAGVPASGLGLRAAENSPTDGYLLAWDRGHPLLQDVALDQVYVTSALVPSMLDGAASRPGVLATGPGGPLMILGADGHHRRLVVAFDVAASNWPLQVSFPVFLATALDYLTLRGEESAGRAFSTGEPVDIVVPRGVSSVELRRVEAPGAGTATSVGSATTGGPESTIRVAVPPDRAGERVPVGLVERAGLYRVAPPGAEPVLAVNLVNAVESACGVSNSLKLGGATVTGGVAVPVPREVWPWLVLAAAGLLVVEWIAFAARARA